MATAMDDRFQFQPLVHNQRAGTFRTVNLVRRDRHRVHAQGLEIHRYLAQRLHRVGMHPGAFLTRLRGDFRNRLNHTGLVICEHDRHQTGGVCERRVHIGQIDQPVWPYGKLAWLPTLASQVLRRLRHAGMLDTADHNLRGLEIRRRTIYEQIVRLGSARYEYHLRGLDIHESCDLLARPVDRLARTSAEFVAAGGVAVLPFKEGQHSLEYARVRGRSGVMVEIDVHRVQFRPAQVLSVSRDSGGCRASA